MTDFKPSDESLLFHDVHRAHFNAVSAELGRRGIFHLGQPKVLFVLEMLPEEGATQRELAEAVHVSPSTMTASLKSLEAQGYVEKHEDSADGRVKRVYITEKGKNVVSQCHEAFEIVDRKLYSGFSKEEIEYLKDNFRRMLANMYAIGGKESPDEECPEPPF